MPSGGRGQLLMPWPNRIGDGKYSFGGRDLQLALSEPGRGNASHGLVRWAAWSIEEHTPHSVSLGYRLMAQTGYPWTLDLHVLYDLSADGLTVTQTATNMAASAAPYAQGAHPYVRAESDLIDRLELLLPGATRLRVDDRMLPTGREPVEGSALRLPGVATDPGDRAGRRVHRPHPGRRGHGDRRAARPGHRARRRPLGRRAASLAPGLQCRRGARRLSRAGPWRSNR